MTTTRPIISIIAAMASNRVIGKANRMPWHMPADLKFFKKTTSGHTLIMGRKTFASIGGKPLPGRPTIVLSKKTNLQYDFQNVQVAHSLEQALQMVKNEKEVFIAGGSKIYQMALPMAHRMYLTLIDTQPEGDTWFPQYDTSQWKVINEEAFPADQKNPHNYRFQTLVNQNNPLP